MTFSETLLSWYNENKRDLPWRRTTDPYYIWVSEIIMQQTRVDQGLNYFLQFVERFPTLHSLSEAEEMEVLNLWQGLGYYTRARNLHHAAKELVSKQQGKFPSDFQGLLTLKGVGKYTASAIASISFNLPFPTVDGNVLRFFSRFFGIHTPIDSRIGMLSIEKLALDHIDTSQPGEFNQAIMEFGALQCKPVNPDCTNCILKRECYAFLNNMITCLPVKSKIVKNRNRYFHYLVLIKKGKKNQQYLFLRKREENDIWKNLYDFPLIETEKPIPADRLVETVQFREKFAGEKITIVRRNNSVKHLLTHQTIISRFYFINTNKDWSDRFIKVSLSEISKFPVPKLIENFIANFLML